MVASEEYLAVAKKILDYFRDKLNSGNNDKLKLLIKAVIEKESSNSLSAESITRVIRESNNKENRDSKSKNVIKAAEKLTGRSNFDSYQEEDFKKDVAKVLKGYDFVNGILRNIPNKAKGVLSNEGNKFTGFKAGLTGDKFESGQYYYDVSVSPCGASPFVSEADGIPRDNLLCLNQFHKIAYTLLEDTNCGRDRLDCFEVKEGCYYAIADRLYDLYNRGNVDGMMIDLSAKYPNLFVGQKSTETIEIKIPEQEVKDCLRSKKKQAEEAIEKLVKATDVMEGVDSEAIKYNNEALDKIVDKIEEKRKIEALDNNKKKEMDDWLIYAKGQMEEKDKNIEEKDREINALKERLKEYESLANTNTLENENINNLENGRDEL